VLLHKQLENGIGGKGVHSLPFILVACICRRRGINVHEYVALQEVNCSKVGLEEGFSDGSTLLDLSILQHCARIDASGFGNHMARHTSNEDEICIPQRHVDLHKHQLRLAPRWHCVFEVMSILQDLLGSSWSRRADYESPLRTRNRFDSINDVRPRLSWIMYHLPREMPPTN
jgi:hypothetical protein